MSDADQGMVDEFLEEIDLVVFAFGALLTVGVMIAAFFINQSAVTEAIGTVYGWVVEYLNWALLVIVFLIVLFLLFLIVGPWGRSRWGRGSGVQLLVVLRDVVLRRVRSGRRVLGTDGSAVLLR